MIALTRPSYSERALRSIVVDHLGGWKPCTRGFMLHGQSEFAAALGVKVTDVCRFANSIQPMSRRLQAALGVRWDAYRGVFVVEKQKESEHAA